MQSSRRSFRLIGAAAVWALLIPLLVVIGVSGGGRADATSASDWDPGYIIDDSVFYDTNSMTADEVQQFLNNQVPSCSAGYQCLKAYGQPTPSRAGDKYCSAYQGYPYQTAAQIIDQVARVCGISQRVLLVMLQKEQGLVTSTAPSSWNYTAAMGQSCPDTAACDPAYAGFFYQVYFGARQLEIYRLNPNSFGYRAQRVNTILYNPNAACGTQQVYIQNQATAALYIYTPYVPNQAALNNLYGSGDSCSSYGNRNFWRLFSDWFGDPHRYTVDPGFVDYWNAHGGASGSLGPPVSYSVFVEQNGQGWYQRFRNGTLYGSYQGGTVFIPNSAILNSYLANSGPYGPLGFPTAEISCSTGGRCSQLFYAAVISSTPQYGGHATWGGLRDFWMSSGGLDGQLGAALNDIAYSDAQGGGWVQNFQGGVVAAGPGGTLLMPGAVPDMWSRTGGAGGLLGWPTSGYACNGTTCAQNFQSGAVTFAPNAGARAVWGGFAGFWQSSGGRDGSLGAATSDVVATTSVKGSGWTQDYQKGSVAISGAGTFAVPTDVAQVWRATGFVDGWLGWPVGAQTCTASVCQQPFQGGIVTSTVAWGAHAVVGSFSPWWINAGGMSSVGAALNDLRFSSVAGGGWIQHFQTGIAAQRVGGPVVLSTGSIQSTWYSWGGETSWLQWPTSDVSCVGTSCGESFQAGALTVSSTAGVRAVVGGLGVTWTASGGISTFGAATGDTTYSAASGGGWLQTFEKGVMAQGRTSAPVFVPSGPILSMWSYYGAEKTWLGFPTGGQTCTQAGACTQSFQGGTASSTASGSVTFTPR